MTKNIIICCVFILLALCIVTTQCTADDITECTTDSTCFPYGVLSGDQPTSKDLNYYCCPQRNRSRRSDPLPDGTYNCSCELDLDLESKIENWARNSANVGRMCVRGENCDGSYGSNIINGRFKFCCFFSSPLQMNIVNVTGEQVTIFDGDKEEFIGCRCGNLPVPTPDPEAYVVPPVRVYNSTGEPCSFDEACQDHPSLTCESRDVTFCCYGSRGLVTENEDGEQITRCTCTDEVFGTQCEARPVAIADTTLPCLTDCANTTDEDKCTDDNNAERCCPNNMAVVASQSGGNFTSCTCQARAAKTCGTEVTTRPVPGSSTWPSSSAIKLGGRLNELLVLVVGVFLSGRIRR